MDTALTAKRGGRGSHRVVKVALPCINRILSASFKSPVKLATYGFGNIHYEFKRRTLSGIKKNRTNKASWHRVEEESHNIYIVLLLSLGFL